MSFVLGEVIQFRCFRRAVKREILTLLSTWIARADLSGDKSMKGPMDMYVKMSAMQDTVSNAIIPSLFDTILQDYSNSVPDAREPKVLSLLSITIFSLRVSLLYPIFKSFNQHPTTRKFRRTSRCIWNACSILSSCLLWK